MINPYIKNIRKAALFFVVLTILAFWIPGAIKWILLAFTIFSVIYGWGLKFK
jgi:diacylglycerol kinase